MESNRETYLDARSPVLLQAPLPRHASIAEACETPSGHGAADAADGAPGAGQRPGPAIPPATSLAPDDGSLVQPGQKNNQLAADQGVFGVKGKGLSAMGDAAVIDQIRGRIALIESCRLHLEQLLSALRSGLLRDLVYQTSNLPVAYSSGEATKHNFPKSRIKTVKVRYNPSTGLKKKAANAAAQPPQGWGLTRLTITIKGFIIELFSHAYTYVFIIVFSGFTLYFRYYLNKS